jgi:uncharacterized protein YggE
MSDDRLRYIEVIGGGPGSAGEDRKEAQRAAFQAARRRAEVLAEEAGLRLTGVQQIAEIPEDGEPGRLDRVRFRVRFSIEPAQSTSGRAGFQATD